MKIISHYLGKTVISSILLVIIILIGVEAFIEFTREFPDIGTGSYNLLQVFAYVPMILPTDIYQLFPMAGLLGSIIGLGLLASHSEIIVIRTCGVSIARITIAVLKAAVLLSLFMLLVGEVLAPMLQHKATANKTIAISSGQALLTQQGIWLKDQNNFIHINKVLSDGHLESITRYNFDEQNKLKLISFAKGAEYKSGQWIFNEVAQTNFNDNNTTSNSFFSTQQWGMKLKPRLVGLTSADTEQKSLPELYRYIKYRKLSGLSAANYEFTFWQRIFQPLASLVMIILAIPFVFGPLRSSTMGLRMLYGAVVGFAFYIINQFTGPLSVVYQIPPIIAALLPTLIFAVCGWILLNKLRL